MFISNSVVVLRRGCHQTERGLSKSPVAVKATTKERFEKTMPSIGPAALFRWLHHRNSSDYRELQESIILGCGGFRGKSGRAWRTVPGLVLEDDDSSSIGFDDNLSRQDMIQMGERMEGQALYRSRAPRTKRFPTTSGATRKTQSHSESKIMDSKSFETTETEDESEQEEHYKPGKVVRWADDTGKELAVTRSIDSLAYISTRIVVLLLDLNERLFEFVQCELSTDERLTVSDILRQIPSFASIESLAQQRYRSLCRPDEELINMLPIQNYDIREGEILVASGVDTRPKEAMEAARTLLSQKRLIKAVHKAKLSGRALQRLMSSSELTEAIEKGRTVGLKIASIPDDTGDEVDDDDMALISKVLSKELGDDLTDSTSEFADFSFPTFETSDDIFRRNGAENSQGHHEKSGDDWFDDLLSFSFAEDDGFSDEVELLSDMPDHLDETSVTSQGTHDDQFVDVFVSSSHAWSERDVVVPDFSVVSL